MGGPTMIEGGGLGRGEADAVGPVEVPAAAGATLAPRPSFVDTW